jgi:hypothetical protein
VHEGHDEELANAEDAAVSASDMLMQAALRGPFGVIDKTLEYMTGGTSLTKTAQDAAKSWVALFSGDVDAMQRLADAPEAPVLTFSGSVLSSS